MRALRNSMLTFATRFFVLTIFLPGIAHAHTSIAVNGSMRITINQSGLVVEYQIECGANAPIDVRSKIDTNSDGSISGNELDLFNKAAQQKLRESNTLCYLLVDTKPAMLDAQKVEFIVDNMIKPQMVLMKFLLVSGKAIPSGSHRLVLESNFCPYDGELLPLPDDAAPLVHQRHGRLVRIIRVVILSESAMKFTHASTGHISTRGGEETVQCILNNITKRLQINFMLGKVQSDQTSSADSNQSREKISPVSAVTGATPAALRSPVQITEISTFDALHFDPKEKEFEKISYRLSKPAWVRIRIVLRSDEQLVLRTLVEWSKRQAGKLTETWDGRDASGNVIDKAKFPCFIMIEADSDKHQKHDHTLCKDLILNLKLKNNPDQTVRGKENIEILVDENTRGYGESFGYQVRAYVDFKLVHSDTYRDRAWQGLDFPLDTTDLAEGEHLLTVIVDDGADHIGSTSLKFNVLNQPNRLVSAVKISDN